MKWLRNVYYHCVDQVKANEISETCGTRGERKEKRTRFFVGKIEEKRLFGRTRHRWGDGIRMDVREIGWGLRIGSDWLRIGTGGELL
jgi:hypothetical protein